MTDPTPMTLKWAREYLVKGFRPVQVHQHTKSPVPLGWQDAVPSRSDVERWFARLGPNVGLVCGQQPNGLNLLAVDIDPKNGGDRTWAELVNGHEMPAAPIHHTPSGGMHLFFHVRDLMLCRTTAGTPTSGLGPGIDTRGVGGQVVTPPSFYVDGDGVIGRYTTSKDEGLLWVPPPDLPDFLGVKMRQPVAISVEHHPSNSNGDNVPEQLRRTWDWVSELERDGWTVEHQAGEQVFMTRPGKDPRHGHSGVIHLDSGCFVAWSSNVPVELQRPLRARQNNSDGSISWSPWDYYQAVRFGGDGKAARASLLSPPARTGLRATQDTGGDSSHPTLNLPERFWQARPVLARICQAARARRASPESLLVNVLARSATLIPPSLKLPAVIGTRATFDFLGCVVAETSGGKTLASGIAREFLLDPQAMFKLRDRDVMFDRSVGSGEGISQAFMVPCKTDDGKPAPGQEVGRQALHLVVDESNSLLAQAARKGSTTIPTLLSAWSGSALGQQNASADTLRIIDAGRVRVTAVINMVSQNADKLFSEEHTSAGLTSRVLFASALDPEAPGVAPDWPGDFKFPIPPGGMHDLVDTVMSYAPEIVAEIDGDRLTVLRGGVVDRQTGHLGLLRCKVASIMAVWEGRLDVTLDDWGLAGEVIETSTCVLEYLRRLQQRAASVTAVTAAERRGELDAVAQSAKERRLVADLSDRLVKRVPPEGIGVMKLTKAMTEGGSKQRDRFPAALERAEADGRVRVVDGRIERGA